jgi:uncharacterized protein YdeI (YjbR/CyaY-like superfamily)
MKPNSRKAGDLPILKFDRKSGWARWLDKNHDASSGAWLRLAKKASGLKSVSYDEALEVALCYGWIDGQGKSGGEQYWFVNFTPRGKRSVWSKRNRKRVLMLIAAGRLKPAGLAEVERARSDGRWDEAYDSSSRITVPDDLQTALGENSRAKRAFDTLDRGNRYAVLFRLHTARKPETRAKRIQEFVRMLARGEKLYR